MVMSCSAYNCTERYSGKSGKRFFRFPDKTKHRKRWKMWVEATKRKDFNPSKSAVLCEKHFVPEDFEPQKGFVRRLKCEAVPHVFDFPKKKSPTKERKSLNSRQASTSLQKLGVSVNANVDQELKADADVLFFEPSAQLDPNEDKTEDCFAQNPVGNTDDFKKSNTADDEASQYDAFLQDSAQHTEEDNAAAAILCALSLQKEALLSKNPFAPETQLPPNVDDQEALNLMTADSRLLLNGETLRGQDLVTETCDFSRQFSFPVGDSSPVVQVEHDEHNVKTSDFCQQCSIACDESSAVLDHSYVSKKNPETPTKSNLRKKVKRLQNQLRRKKRKIEHLEDIVASMRDHSMITESCSDLLIEQFSGLPLELFKHESANIGRIKNSYSEEIRKMAVTLHFYSPRGYDYMRTFLTLPHPRTLRNWKSSVQNEPGFFPDIFKVDLVLKI